LVGKTLTKTGAFSCFFLLQEGDPQHQHCSEVGGGAGFSMVLVTALTSLGLLVLSWLTDPASGVKGLRPRSWEEAVEVR
jgi:hypothetical protein